MARYFFDTSVLAKAFHNEAGSEEVLRIYGAPDREVVISSLSTVEFQSVFARKVRMGLLSEETYRKVRRKFGGDMKAKRVRMKCLLRRHQAIAEKLVATHGPVRGLRTLDSLQLAMAIEFFGTGFVDYFVAADEQLLVLARIEGLAIINPCNA